MWTFLYYNSYLLFLLLSQNMSNFLDNFCHFWIVKIDYALKILQLSNFVYCLKQFIFGYIKTYIQLHYLTVN